MSTSERRAIKELAAGDQLLLPDGTTVTVTDAYPAGPRLTWLELSNGNAGAADSAVLLTVVAG
jgi:hypothetical protein